MVVSGHCRPPSSGLTMTATPGGPVVRDPARLGEQPDPFLPLALGQPDFHRERVEMASQTLRQLAEARVRALLERGDYRRGDVFRGDALAGADHTGGSGSYWM